MFTKGAYLGGGGFGHVYVVTDSIGQKFALKELKIDAYAHDAALAENIAKRFRQEAIKQAAISHYNVIRVLHQQLDAVPPYFVMELADGTLEAVIKKYHAGLMSFDVIKTALFNVLSGLDALHELGIWHRDLKPQNVLYLAPQRFAISDFGLIAVRDGQATTLTITGTTAGSAGYSPPEFIQDFKKASATSDIYSFGAILHDVFVRAARVPYSELRDGVHKIGAVIAKCTKTKQYQRYRSIEELRSDLFDAITEFEDSGAPAKLTIDLGIFSAATFSEVDCDSIIDMIESADAPTLHEIYKAVSIDFIENIYLASKETANHIAEQFAKYVLTNAFDFNYSDVLADKLSHFFQKGDIATKAITLLALLELGTTHNRWYVEYRFVKFAAPDCNPFVIKRFILEGKTNDIDVPRRLAHLFDSITVTPAQLHPQIIALLA